jgi:spermidine synthase
VVLLGSVFVVAACGLVYELVAGAVSSYLLGDATTQFSLVIGVFLCAMGLGSYLAKFIRENLLRNFVEIEIWIGLAGGLSSIAMFAVNAFADPIFPVFFYSLCALLGVLVGIEIPLLVRILRGGQGFSEALSNVLALDYLGALAGALLFPLLVLPLLGLSRASVVFGLMNLAVAWAGLKLIEGPRLRVALKLSFATVLLIAALAFSARMVGFLEDLLYQDSVVYAETSTYQRIVITRWRDDVRLYLNGHIQFSSIDEARYHEPLVIPAMEAAGNPRNVLILGGGDGLAAREILKYESVERIVLVDIDPAVTALGKTRPEIVALNKKSLSSPKLKIVNTDALLFLKEDRGFYDVVIVDLPDPSSENLAKLYSGSFYALIARRLSLGGVLATQATSPFFAPRAFWCIVNTVENALALHPDLDRLEALPYHAHVPSFGEWGFVLAARREIEPEKLSPSVEVRFLDTATLHGMFAFSPDLERPDGLAVNTLENPVLAGYYREGWKSMNE